MPIVPTPTRISFLTKVSSGLVPAWRWLRLLRSDSRLKRLSSIGIALLIPSGLLAAQSVGTGSRSLITLTNAQQVVELGREGARRSPHPVQIRGQLTCVVEGNKNWIYVQDGPTGVLVIYTNIDARPKTGQRLEIRGIATAGLFHSYVGAAEVRVLGEEPLPRGKAGVPSQLAAGADFGTWTTLQFEARDVGVYNNRLLILHGSAGDQQFAVRVPHASSIPLPFEWRDAVFEAQGIPWTLVDAQLKPYGFRLHVPESRFLSVLKPGLSNLFDRPVASIRAMREPAANARGRLKIRGVVNYVSSNGWFSLRDDTGAIRAEPLRLVSRAEFTSAAVSNKVGDTVVLAIKEGVARFVDHPPAVGLQPGDEVEAVGATTDGTPRSTLLTEVEYRVLGHAAPPEPRTISVQDALSGRFDAELVRMTARVIDRQSVPSGSQWSQTFWLQSGEATFEATLLSDQPVPAPTTRHGFVEVAGLCVAMPGELQQIRSVRLYLRDPSDLRPAEPPGSWASPPVLKIAVGAGLVILLGLAWVALLRRQVAQRTVDLSASEERFSKAFRASSVTLAILDAEDRRYVDVNDAFLRAYGYERDEVIGRTSVELGLWEKPEQRDEAYRRYQQDGSLRDFESFIRSRSGDRRVILQSGDFITIGRRRCILSVGQDITDRKQAEVELLRALAREKELGELKSNFVSMVSHEYRNPLEIVQSSSDILQRYADRLTAEQKAEHFQAIQLAVRRMSHMLDEVLLLGKVESGRMQFNPAPMDLRRLCERLVKETAAATEHRCPIALEIQPEIAGAQGDESLLQHILGNLLSNAVKYSPPGVPVRLQVSAEKANVVFCVQDQGCGIPAADQERLFQSFHRARNVQHISGTGLGLVIVKRCVEMHRGSIAMESAEGEGTRFTVRLPMFADGAPDHQRKEID